VTVALCHTAAVIVTPSAIQLKKLCHPPPLVLLVFDARGWHGGGGTWGRRVQDKAIALPSPNSSTGTSVASAHPNAQYSALNIDICVAFDIIY